MDREPVVNHSATVQNWYYVYGDLESKVFSCILMGFEGRAARYRPRSVSKCNNEFTGHEIEVRAEDFDWLGITILEYGNVPTEYIPEVSIANCCATAYAVPWSYSSLGNYNGGNR